MRKILSAALCILIALCSVVPAFADITDAETPISAEETQLKWSVKLGTSYVNAPSVPAVSGGYVYTMSRNTLYKLDAENGETVKTAEMCSEPSFGYTPVFVIDEKIFCPLEGGIVQAFDAETMQPLWKYEDTLGGQALSSVVYDGGYIYTGFWNDEELDANYICLDAENGSLIWNYTLNGGFYWAESIVCGDYIIIGGDNGSIDTHADGCIRSFNKNTGEMVDAISVKGDIRCGISGYGNSLYAVTKAGYIYKTSVDSNGFFSETRSAALTGASTSTPVAYMGKVYIGVQSNGFNGNICILDAESLSLLQTIPMAGYPQSEVLITTAYSEVYIYTTYNSSPGGIDIIFENNSHRLFTPDDGYRSYCISPVVADENGTLYYKNDSGTVFAIEKIQPEAEKTFFEMIIDWIKSIFEMLINLFV